MSDTNHYSLARARRSLIHFGIGKGASAGFGLFALVLTVRLLPATDYGIYVALIAFLEIYYLVTGFGLSTVAQRYITEHRIKSHPAHFCRFVVRMVLLRLLYALLGAGALILVAEPLLHLFAIDLARETQWQFGALLVFGSCTRYLDEVFPALLLQAYTQVLLFMSNVLKVLILGSAALLGLGFGFGELLLADLLISFLALLGGLLLLWRYLAIDRNLTSGETTHENPLMWRVALRFYFVQLLGQVYGPNAIKLLLSRFIGLAQTAAFGFYQALVDMIRNYLPAYLLATWVRPLMVSRYLDRRDLREVSMMANLLFKLSLMGVAPFAAFFAVHGDAFSAWVSAGKYVEAGTVLTLLSVVLALQSLHVVLGMIVTTVERPDASIVATLACCIALPLAAWLSLSWGLAGVATAMALAECQWIGIAWTLLARDGLRFSLDLYGATKIFAAGLIAAAGIRAISGPVGADWTTLIPLALAGLIVLGAAALLKPFRADERELIGRLIPARFFIW